MELRKAEKEVDDAVAAYQVIASTNIKGIESNQMNSWEELLTHGTGNVPVYKLQDSGSSEIEIPVTNDEISPNDFLIQLESLRDRVISLNSLAKKFKERSEMVRSCHK